MSRLAPAAAVLVLALSIAACGDGEETSTDAATTTESSSTTVEETTTESTAVDSENVNTDFGTLTPDVEVDERVGLQPNGDVGGDLESAAGDGGCDLEVDLPDEGNDHFSNPDKVPDYGTNPPTSGPHLGAVNEVGVGAFADGAFLDTPPANRVVHSLEHGRVAIQYSPDLPEADQLALKGVFDEDRPGVLLFPNAEMPYEVAVTAWTRMLGCDSYDGVATLDAVRLFRDEFRGKGPEAVTF